MKVSEIMTREVVIIQPDESLNAAAKKMRDQDIGFLPVCDGEELVGVISDRDITIRALADGMELNVMLSRDLMTTPAIYCFDDQDVSEAARIMKENQIRRLVVLGRDDNRVLGVISLGDLARNETASFSGKVLKKVSERVNMETEDQQESASRFTADTRR
jgi:CBS domain-containing protein